MVLGEGVMVGVGAWEGAGWGVGEAVEEGGRTANVAAVPADLCNGV